MANQLKEIYTTGNPSVDSILNRIGQRLDVLEGLNPDIQGLLEIAANKGISAVSPVGDMVSQNSDDIDISGGSITGVTVEISGGTVDDTPLGETTASTGKFTTLSAEKITITDSNGTTIHQLGEQ